MNDLISRQAAIDALKEAFNPSITNFVKAKIAIENLPSVQPETHDKRTKTHSCDCISRQDAIDAFYKHPNIDWTTLDVLAKINALPPAQHDLSEYSDKLWKKAYERGRAEALDEIVRCKDCKYNSNMCGNYVNCDIIPQMFGRTVDNFCSMAERRTDE